MYIGSHVHTHIHICTHIHVTLVYIVILGNVNKKSPIKSFVISRGV